MHPLTPHLDERVAIVGRSGTGKTFGARGGVEAALAAEYRVCVIDPMDVWYGLRVKPNGKSPAFPVVIFGGAHADIPITEASGAIVGKAIAGTDRSCVVSLGSLIGNAARRRFCSALLDALYDHNRAPLLLVIDEADFLAPQKPQPGFETLLGHMQDIVRRGRVRGFVPWLITQRPAVLSKDVLSQADVLVAMNLTAKQDRDAIGGWIEGQADQAEAKRILAALPKLKRGEGYVWAPAVDKLERHTFPPISTFDSGRTPKRGEKIAAAELGELDVDGLRAELAGLEQTKTEKTAGAVSAGPLVLPADVRVGAVVMHAGVAIATLQSAIDRFGASCEAEGHRKGFVVIGRRFAASLERTTEDLRATLDRIKADIDRAESIPSSPKSLAPATAAQPPVAVPTPAVARAGASGGAELRILKVLAQRHPARFTRAQWATLAGMSKGGGTFATYISRLRTAGYLDESDGMVSATAEGLAACGTLPPAPQTPQQVAAMWKQSLGGGPARMIDVLFELYPEGIDRANLADRLGMTASGGTFATYLSRLRSNGLIEEHKRRVVASAVLFGAMA